LPDTKTTRSWSLYWRDRNLRFHVYDLLAPSPLVDDLLAEIGATARASSGAETSALG
jgi:hypothetical protein